MKAAGNRLPSSPAFSKPVPEAGDNAGPAGGLHESIDDLQQRAKEETAEGDTHTEGARAQGFGGAAGTLTGRRGRNPFDRSFKAKRVF